MATVYPRISELRAAVHAARIAGKTIGVVPTMGALHDGHAELIRQARKGTDFVVVTVFVNPTQFDRPEDLAKYPRDLATDVKTCEQAGADVVFAPPVEEMYPGKLMTSVEVTGVSDKLEGEYRPGHFKGVATVVAKLLNIAMADRAYFGEKDAQQLAVIQKMVADLDIPTEIVPVATVRESDGLAMSSRSRLLSAADRAKAPELYRALSVAKEKLREGALPADARTAAVEAFGEYPEIQVQYLEIADAATMQPVQAVNRPRAGTAAVWLGGVRLIDNVLVK